MDVYEIPNDLPKPFEKLIKYKNDLFYSSMNKISFIS